MDMLDFLMGGDITIEHMEGNFMSADESFVLGGEFVVFSIRSNELYRGLDFELAMKYLTGEIK